MLKKIHIIVIVVIAVIVFLVGSYLSLRDKGSDTKEGVQNAAKEGVLHYTCGMHPSVKVSSEEYARGNILCPICNMKLVPVYKESSKEEAYYGCGMEGAEHVFTIEELKGMRTCPICGMPLVKLSKEEAEKLKGLAGKIKLNQAEVKRVGVLTMSVEKLPLFKVVRIVGRVAYDPDLAVAEEEYISSLNAYGKMGASVSDVKSRAARLVESAEKKLKLLGLNNEQIGKLRETRKVHSSLVLPDEKMWVYGDVYEYELTWLREGERVKVVSEAFPGEVMEGFLTSINPTVDPKTRSVRIRAEVENKNLKLKPDMYVDIEIMSRFGEGDESVLAVPKSSVLNTGTRNIIWFDEGDGRFVGREVLLGPLASAELNGRVNEYYPVLRGAREGERVVAKANFLIDSQSQLSGQAASAYSGALGGERKNDEDENSKKKVQMHQH